MYRALIVDDESPARQAILMLGQWEKYGVERPLEADSARSALKLISVYRPNIVFTDIRMPVMDGLSFLSQVVETWPKTKFIISSGYSEFEYAQQGIRHGVVEYLLKPFDEKVLNLALSRATALLDIEDSSANEGMNIFVRYLRDTPRMMESIGEKRLALDRIVNGSLQNSCKSLQSYLSSLVNTSDSISEMRFCACEVLIALRDKAISLGSEEASQLIMAGVSDESLSRIGSKEMLLEVMLKVYRETFRNILPSDALAKEDIVRRVKAYIESNYAREISLDQFANEFYMTKEYLSRCFKEVEGCAIYEYVTQKRMEAARNLLLNTDSRIYVVASRVGYQDQNYFSKVFKHYYGVHPTKYRIKRENT